MVTHWYKRAHVTVAGVSTLDPGLDATVVVDENNAMTFGIPQGEKGAKGDQGATPAFAIGTVTTLDAGQYATASITGTAAAPVLNLGIPKGPKGEMDNVDATQILQHEGATGSIDDALTNVENNLVRVDRLSVTLASDGWSSEGTGEPYTQSIAFSPDYVGENILDTAADLDMSEATVGTAPALLAAWNAIGRISVSNTGMIAYCYNDTPPATTIKVVLTITWKHGL